MWQMIQSIEQCSSQQEKNSDLRLATMLESERKRDELYLNFQREQAEANRRHELQMAQLLMQSGAGQSLPSMALPIHLSAPGMQTYPHVPRQQHTWHDMTDGGDRTSAGSIPFYEHL